MTPERLAEQLTSPLLAGLDGTARLSLSDTNRDLFIRLSAGERDLLTAARHLHLVQINALGVDDQLRADIADCCLTVATAIKDYGGQHMNVPDGAS